MRQNVTLIEVICGIFSCVSISAMASTMPQDEVLEIDTTIPGGLETTREEFPPRRSPLRTMQQVHDFLSKSATLKSIKLRVTLLGCSSHPHRYNFPFDFPAGSRYSFKLESLRLDGYDFGYQEWNRVQPPSKLFPLTPTAGLRMALATTSGGTCPTWRLGIINGATFPMTRSIRQTSISG